MSSNQRARTARTFQMSSLALEQREKARRHADADPQGYLTPEVVGDFVDAGMCPFCPAGPFSLLPVHTGQAHGIDKRELRRMAGRSSNEPISSEAFRSRQREIAIERGQVERMRGLQSTGARTYTDAGRAKIAATVRKTYDRMTPAQREAMQTKLVAGAKRPETQAKRSATLRARYAEDPALGVATAGRMRTPEAQARYREAMARRKASFVLPDHGTPTRYKHGCRCEPCREAKREYRAKLDKN